jgi:hypothetical protein
MPVIATAHEVNLERSQTILDHAVENASTISFVVRSARKETAAPQERDSAACANPVMVRTSPVIFGS